MRIQLPEQFENRMKEMLADEFDEFLEAYNEADYHGLRINSLKAEEKTPGEIRELFATRPVPWCETGYYYDEDMRPGRHPYHHAGVYYIQEPSAMFVGQLAKEALEDKGYFLRDDIHILDLCAAPGGKTSHLAGLMNGQGVLVANEIIPGRAKILSQNVERMGIGNCIVTNESPDRLATVMPGYFDMIVVDTPCSGEGMFRRDEIARTEWSPANVKMCAMRGQDILDAADRMLRYGGILIYSTCTFAPDEDEQAITSFIKKHPEYFIKSIEIKKSEGAADEDGWPSSGRSQWCGTDVGCTNNDIEKTYRLWPHRLHGEGHYAAVLVKGHVESVYVENGESIIVKHPDNKREKVKKNSKDQKTGLSQAIKLFEEFAAKFVDEIPVGEYQLFGNNLYLVPNGSPKIDTIKFERAGLQLGELKKDRFEPAHALAISLKPNNCKKIHNILDEKDMIKYLCGESVQCDTGLSGWCVVTFSGYTAGLGKANNGIIKNHYPKGLRIKM